MERGPIVTHGGSVEQHRPAGHFSQPIVEIHILLKVRAGLGELDEPFFAAGEHLEQKLARLPPPSYPSPSACRHSRAVLRRIRCLDVGTEKPQPPAFIASFEDATHLLHFFFRRRAALRRFQTHHPDHDWRNGDVAQHVDPLWGAIEEVQPVREGDPVPLHPGLHRLERNRFDAGHGEHGAITQFRLARRETEPAVANHDRGYAMPAGQWCNMGPS